MSKKRKSYIGRIYTIEPEHIIKKRDLANYNASKQTAANNKRPVMIGVQRRGKSVQVSPMTSKARQDQIDNSQKVKMTNSYPKRDSFVNTTTIGKSRKTGKPFKIGRYPLTRNNRNGTAHPDDVSDYKKERSKLINWLKKKNKK